MLGGLWPDLPSVESWYLWEISCLQIVSQDLKLLATVGVSVCINTHPLAHILPTLKVYKLKTFSVWFLSTVLLVLLNDFHSSGGFSLIHHPVKVSLGQKFLTAEQAGIWSLGKKKIGTKFNLYIYLYMFGVGSFVIVPTTSDYLILISH